MSQSIIGSFLDPLADKLMVGSLCFSMTWSGLIPLPLAGLIFGRDFLLVTGTVLHRKKTKSASAGFFDTSDGAAFEVEPTTLSKVNTALQFSMFGLALMNGAWQFLGDPMLDILL
jgi:cardiolipin synthase